jgi:integrase
MLPESLKADLTAHLQQVKRLHEEDLRAGNGRVYLPDALSRKHPNAPAEWGWQYVFPAPSLSRDPRSGDWRRHHLHERGIQRAFQGAVRATGIVCPASTKFEGRNSNCRRSIVKLATCHTLRHSFATHLLTRQSSCRVSMVPLSGLSTRYFFAAA